MTKLPSGAIGVAGDQIPRTGSSARTHELKLLMKVHHREESRVLSAVDPGPAGFDFVLPNDDPDLEVLRALLSRGSRGRRDS